MRLTLSIDSTPPRWINKTGKDASMTETVLQVLPALDAGGVERGTLEVGAELVRNGYRSLVVSAGGRMVPQLLAEGSEHFECPIGKKSPLILRWVPFMRRLLTGQQVDIVHLRSRIPAWVTYLAWKSLPVAKRPRLITSVHGQYSVSRFSQIMTQGEIVIAVSNTIREYILKNYSTPPDKIRVIHRGVDPAEFPLGHQPSESWKKAFFDQYPAAATENRVASASQTEPQKLLTLPGRITRLKGHDVFVSMIEQLVNEGRLVHGLIVGGEHPRKKRYGNELRQLISERGLSDHITLTGHRTDMKEIYALSDVVFSLSSKPESFGRTVVEALALGTPVVGYNHGGVGEILANEFSAGLIPVGDSAALLNRTRHLCSAAASPQLDGYRLSTMLQKTLDVYAQLRPQRRVRSRG
jgi:glycosyltransferase involved in cell wall biosynthesis